MRDEATKTLIAEESPEKSMLNTQDESFAILGMKSSEKDIL